MAITNLKSLLLLAAIAGPGAAIAATQVVTLSLPDMSCGVCPLLVKQSLMKVDGVVGVEPDLARREATVTFDEDEASASELMEAAREAGYPSRVLHTYPVRPVED